MVMQTILLALSFVSLLIATPAVAGDLTVNITGVKAKGGTLLVAVYDKETLFRAKPPFVRTAKVTQPGDVTVTVKDVTAGDYVVSVLHDADDNQAMTMAADGKFGEGTALINAELLRGPPTFDVNKITIPATGASVTLAMSYPEDRTGW